MSPTSSNGKNGNRRVAALDRSKANSNGNSLPAYRRIQNTIREKIEDGKLRAGELVDSERELARSHGVSLMTARHALAELQREGLVERHRGSGTYVAPPKIQFNKLISFTEQMASRSIPGHSRVIHFSVVHGEPEIAARLALPPGSRLLMIERLREAAGEPFSLETCFLSADSFAGMQRSHLERGSIFGLLEQEYDTKLSYADEDVDATSADPKTAETLAVPRGAPLLRIRQTIFSTTGKAVLYVLGFYRSDRHILHIRRFR
ncbi:MAG: GntR family transcriptional regulator [Acidobacteria bacterium]|nr:GntR family transcriptional regulator [Acidobacteriota bacterium]